MTPAGSRSDARFVIQQHAASRPHYDLRLEVGGRLKSWAVPRGPSTDPRDRRLAVRVEDHPLEFADFEGTIQSGYGAGTLIVWDAGHFTNLRRNEAGEEIPLPRSLADGRVEIWLEGRKLRGGYVLLQSRLGGNDDHWLLLKMDDEAADAERDPIRTQPESVVSGLTLGQVARARGGSER